MGMAHQLPTELLSGGLSPQLALEYRPRPEVTNAPRPARRLGQVICLASCVLSAWMYWNLAGFVVSQF